MTMKRKGKIKIVVYNINSSSSDSDVETEDVDAAQQRTLPPPDAIAALFHNDAERTKDVEISHDGRVRAFPHVEGNWSTHVLIPYEPEEDFFRLQTQLFKCLRIAGEFRPMDDYHVSLSRTVVIRHHWIQPLVDSLRLKFSTYPRFCCELENVVLYTNDEKSRTFVALDVCEGVAMLSDLTKIIDSCFVEYNLPPYYPNPRFHVSIGWMPGDVQTQVEPATLASLSQICQRFWLEDDPDSRVIQVNHIEIKAGNKQFNLPLSNS